MGDDFTSERIGPVPTTIIVRYVTGNTCAFPDRNWRVEQIGPDATSFLIIGDGIPCTFIPLVNVLSFDIVTSAGQS